MFGGFKASLNFFGKKNNKGLHSQLSPDMTVSGAYRISRDDSFGYHNSFDQTKKSTASKQALQQMRPTKSANDLAKAKNVTVTPNLRQSTADVSRDPRGAPQDDPRNDAQDLKDAKNQEKEQKRLEKQRLAEQKARQKQAAQEQAKQEKLRREREKKEAQQGKAKRERRPEKRQAPQPKVATPVAQTSTQYPTNTLESSISRSSGPPPYSDVPTPGPEPNGNAQSQGESSGNVMYSKPVDTGSWDMISHHRQQIIRPTTVIGGGGNKKKQLVMDLNYNFEATPPSQTKDNSDV